ncbi:MAG: NAD(P)/FAD-dependent oxidoreductase [Granulosicoccus sp.]
MTTDKKTRNNTGLSGRGVSVYGPDFPFAYDDWLQHAEGLGQLPQARYGEAVAVIGAGVSGTVAAYELMKLGLYPVVYEAGRIGGRLRSERFANTTDTVAELGGMRFPQSATTFNHYIKLLGLKTRPFPNPLTKAAGTTVIDLAGVPLLARSVEDLPPIFQEVAAAWDEALETEAHFNELQAAIVNRDTATIKLIWNQLVHDWDDRTFYDFIATSDAFRRLSYRHREIFGQVGFGTGGWDSDFRNTMLEILRVVLTECDTNQHLIIGGAEQLPRGLWQATPQCKHWPVGTSLQSLNGGAPRPGVAGIHRINDTTLCVTDQYENGRKFSAVLATCQSWLLTTSIDTDEALFSQEHWMALDRTSYMQSSKTFIMVDRPFWKDIDPDTGDPCMSMTLTDRLTRGTYLMDNGHDKPAVICLSYAWMADALKMLPLTSEKRVELALRALENIYPKLDIRRHIIGLPISISWEADANFLGAFKGALPGHYRYNRRMYTHFMQETMEPRQRGIFIAGDDVSWTPGWAEGAVQTALNAVWGMVNHLGGKTPDSNPGPGDVFKQLAPIDLDA